MTDAERLHRLALLILNSADDPDRVREGTVQRLGG